MSMEPTTFTVIELKEQLRVMGLLTAETNTELIARLTETDPARELLEKLTKCRQGGKYEVTNTDEDALGALGAQGEEPSERNEWIRRFELLEKEVLLLRLENEALRQRRALASEIRVTEVPTQRRTYTKTYPGSIRNTREIYERDSIKFCKSPDEYPRGC